MERTGDSRTDRRAREDRRARPTALLDGIRYRRRREVRREGGRRGGYVDCLRPDVVWMLVFIVFASGCDALLTMFHLAEGGDEVNPFMEAALTRGIDFFVALKMGVTAVSGLCIAAHQLFPIGLASLRFLCLTYLALLVYHCVLFGYW